MHSTLSAVVTVVSRRNTTRWQKRTRENGPAIACRAYTMLASAKTELFQTVVHTQHQFETGDPESEEGTVAASAAAWSDLG